MTKVAAAATSDFTSLTAEWDTLVKALDAGEGAGEGDGKKPDAEGGEGGEGDGKKPDAEGGEGDGEAFGKSFEVTLEDGTKVDAFDGTAMMKALHAENVTLRADLDVQVANNGEILKALTASRTVLTSQGALLKSLQAEIARIGSQGTGRKTVLAVHEKVTGGGEGKPEGVTPKDFMAKAMDAFKAGTITGADVNLADARLQRGIELPADLIAKVMGTKA